MSSHTNLNLKNCFFLVIFPYYWTAQPYTYFIRNFTYTNVHISFGHMSMVIPETARRRGAYAIENDRAVGKTHSTK